MIGNQERDEYEAIQREEALKRIQSLVRRYDFRPAEILALSFRHTSQAPTASEGHMNRKFDPFFDAW